MFILLNYIFIVALALRKHHSTLNLSNIHFSSSTETTHNFELLNLQLHKDLVIIPKLESDNYRHNKSLSPIISLKINSINCTLNSTLSYCIAPSLQATRVTVESKCLSSPCSIALESYQTMPITQVDSKKALQRVQLIKINKQQGIVMISCNDSTIKQFSNELILRTNSEYSYNDKGNKIYLIFNKVLGQLIIQASQKATKCGSYDIVFNPSSVKLNSSQKIIMVDKKRIDIEGVFKNDLQLDIDMMSSDNLSSKARVSVYVESSPPMLLMSSQVEDIKQTKVFNLIVKKEVFEKYNKKIYIEVDPHNHSLLGSFNPIQSNAHLVELDQVSYFNLTQNQQINYKFDQIEDNMLVNITATTLGQLALTSGNRTTNQPNLIFKCLNKTCEFSIKALSKTTIGFIQLLSTVITKHDIKYLPLENSLQLKMKEDEIKYLIINRPPAKQMFLIYVSSPNIITYVGGEICPQPSAACHDYSGSDMSPIVIQTEQTTLYVTLQALETTSFTISIQNRSSKAVELKDAVPVKIDFKQDTSILFSYKIQQISTVYLNLLSTPSMFTMYVVNSNETPDEYAPYKSNSFIRIDKEEVVEKQFTILVKRIGTELNQKITIIASNSLSLITIDKGNPYYDNFAVNQKKYYLLVLGSDEDKVRVSLEITPLSNEYNLSLKLGPRKDFMMHNLSVKSSFNSLNLDKQIERICDQSDSEQFCQIYIELENNGDKEIDTTFTVTVNESIIELKSGIWQKYQIDSVSKLNKFYFIPKNKRNIFIELTSIYANHKLEYKLWNNSQKQINKQMWPFPNTTTKQDNKHGITVTKKDIQTCYPTCVVLVTVISIIELPSNLPITRIVGWFSVMATDSILELKQNQRSMVTLAANESKFLVVDLTQHLKQQQAILTFTVNRILGFYTILAKAAGSEYDPPSVADHQYNLNNKYVQIRMSDIVSANPEAKQMILMVTGTQLQSSEHSILSIMYTTSSSIIKQLPMSMLTTLKLQARSSELYKIQFWKQYRIKIMRKQGFPFLSFSQCPQDDMDKCIENIDKKQIQIVSKVDQIKPTNSSNMMLLKIFSKNQEVLLDILAASKDMSIRLFQGTILPDFGQKQEENKYTLLVYRTKQTKIFITVYEGSPTAILKSQMDGFSLNGTQTSNLIIFNVLPSMYKNTSWLFVNLDLSIKDTKMNCSYSVSYTVNSNIELIDGLVTAGTIKPKQNITYNYHGKLNDKMIVSVTFKDSEMLKRCKIQILQTGVENTTLQPHLQHIQSNTPNPTIVFNLEENYTSYQIRFKNTDAKSDISYNISVNYVDIILLPLGYEYPVLLKEDSNMNMILEIENEAVVEFKIKKCNSQDLLFSYTQNIQQFKKGKFTNEIDIDQHIHTSKVHVKASTLFIRVSSKTGVLLAVQVKATTKQKQNIIKPGNQGVVEYMIRERQKAEIQFTPVVCHQKCPKPIKYEYVLGTKLEDVEAQTICQSSFFLATNQTLLKSLSLDAKKAEEPGKLGFSISINQDMQYLGFRAVLPDGEQIPYQIIQLSTVWGQIQKHTNRHFWTFSIVSLFIFCCCFIGLRFQNRRKGRYEPLPQ